MQKTLGVENITTLHCVETGVGSIHYNCVFNSPQGKIELTTNRTREGKATWANLKLPNSAYSIEETENGVHFNVYKPEKKFIKPGDADHERIAQKAKARREQLNRVVQHIRDNQYNSKQKQLDDLLK